LKKPKGSLQYVSNHLERILNGRQLNVNTKFRDNCLEHRLDKRLTDYNLDTDDNVKVLLAVSGAGKTRMLLELLHSNFGYYFTVKSPQSDFGSGDLYLCQWYCDSNAGADKVQRAIKLLYFVRVTVCNYLIEKGFNKPW
jgi:hypothetical protein